MLIFEMLAHRTKFENVDINEDEIMDWARNQEEGQWNGRQIVNMWQNAKSLAILEHNEQKKEGPIHLCRKHFMKAAGHVAT
jgi:hypothetical protein